MPIPIRWWTERKKATHIHTKRQEEKLTREWFSWTTYLYGSQGRRCRDGDLYPWTGSALLLLRRLQGASGCNCRCRDRGEEHTTSCASLEGLNVPEMFFAELFMGLIPSRRMEQDGIGSMSCPDASHINFFVLSRAVPMIQHRIP